MMQAADRLLSIVLATGVDRVRYSAAPEALEELASVGAVTLSNSSVPPHVDEEDAMQGLSANDTNLVQVDALQVLRESVAQFSFTLGAVTQGFVELCRADLPAGCSVYFLLRNSTALYAIRALAKAPALIVLHVNDDIVDENENVFLHPLGVHAARLRTLESLLAPASLASLAATLQAAFSASATALGTTPSAEIAPQVDPGKRERPEADPSLLPDYASTSKEHLFEQATARVLQPMFQWLLPLGIAFSGRPVPDGVVFRSSSPSPQSRSEVAHYDCKSKSKNSYDLAPGDGDQQERYLAIQRRLEDERGWRGRGVLMFTPDVAPETMADKTQKEAWARVLADNRELIFIPAQVSRRWWELQQLEAAWQLKSFVSPALIWSALFDGTLPGITPAVSRRLLPVHKNTARLLDVAVAELIWIAGLHGFPDNVDAVAKSLQATDQEGTIEEKLRLPALMTKYVDSLAQKGATLESIANATSLQPVGVEYLLRSQQLTNRLSIDLGRYLSENHLRLRTQLDKGPSQ
jgi:hypothetical protein